MGVKNTLHKNNLKLTLTGFFIALGLLLPFVIGQIPQIGRIILPLHIPIFLCGLICGRRCGLIAGFITPLLRSFIFGMPVFMPEACSMAFELAAYGYVSGLLYFKSQKDTAAVIKSCAAAMIIGRLVYGAAAYIFWTLNGNIFTFKIFITAAFINALPSMLIQLFIYPKIIKSLKIQTYSADFLRKSNNYPLNNKNKIFLKILQPVLMTLSDNSAEVN